MLNIGFSFQKILIKKEQQVKKVRGGLFTNFSTFQKILIKKEQQADYSRSEPTKPYHIYLFQKILIKKEQQGNERDEFLNRRYLFDTFKKS